MVRSEPAPVPEFERLATTIVEATKASAGPSTLLSEKIQFSKYDGKMDSTVLYSWLHQFNAYFSVTPKTDNNKVLLASMHLSGDAILWYQEWTDRMRFEHAAEHAETSLFERAPPFSFSWDVFQKDLKTRFHPPQYLDRLEDDFRAVKQNNAPVLTYANKVMHLGVQLWKSDKERLGAFLYGLDLLIKFDVQTQCPDTMAEAMRMAQLQEMKHNHGKLKTDSTDSFKKKTGNGNGQGKNSPAQGKGDKSSETKGKAQDSNTPQLTPDQKATHGIFGGKIPKDEIETYKKEGRCFTCHMKQDYPKKTKPEEDSSEEVSPHTPTINAIVRRVSHPETARVRSPPTLKAKQEGVASMRAPHHMHI